MQDDPPDDDDLSDMLDDAQVTSGSANGYSLGSDSLRRDQSCGGSFVQRQHHSDDSIW